MFFGDDFSVMVKLLKLTFLMITLAQKRKATDFVSGLVLFSYTLN